MAQARLGEAGEEGKSAVRLRSHELARRSSRTGNLSVLEPVHGVCAELAAVGEVERDVEVGGSSDESEYGSSPGRPQGGTGPAKS